MGIINVLDTQVANLIAAGEVVERPSSAVKELLENSIDAGATSITIEIQHGGISFIRITDNGKGMSKEDAQMCIKRHATSKIRSASDLDGIITLGFRGEALAAIASVSKMRIMTKQKGSLTGTLVCVEAGEVTETRETGCAEGTTIIAEELFYNVPARRKFLKKDSSEGMAIASMVEKIAMAEPSISFKFISDGNVKLSTSGNGKLYDVIYQIYGKDFCKKLIEVDNTTDSVEVKGYISNPDCVRANRNFQSFYINGRYVKSRTVIAAFEQAYDSYIPADKFPSCVLKIKLHPAFVDVNVHPSKLEVKFSNEQSVFDAVYCAIRNTLTQKLMRPGLELEDKVTKLTADYLKVSEPFVPVEEPKRVTAQVSAPTQKSDEVPKELEKRISEVRSDSYFAPAFSTQSPAASTVMKEEEIDDGVKIGIPFLKFEQIDASSLFGKITEKEPAFSESQIRNTERVPCVEAQYEKNTSSDAVPELFGSNAFTEAKNGAADRKTEAVPKYRIIGEAFDSYVFIELEENILVIDKHAAHERIIFEELKRNMQSGKTTSQILLLPCETELSAEEFSAVEEYRSDIEKTGFAFETSKNGHGVKITEIPSEISVNSASDVFSEMANKLASGTGNAALSREILYEKALYQASCKAAIKAGRKYGEEHIKWICDKLLSLPDIKFCPHGRPVAFELSRHELEHKFKRV